MKRNPMTSEEQDPQIKARLGMDASSFLETPKLQKKQANNDSNHCQDQQHEEEQTD